MAFTQETAKEAGKRSKRGKDNKISTIRDFYTNFLNNNNDKLQSLFDEVAENEPSKALDFLLKMSSYIIPKPRPTDIGDANNPFLDYSNVPEWLRPKKEIDELTEEEYQKRLAQAKKVIAAAGEDKTTIVFSK